MHWSQLWHWNALWFGYCGVVLSFCLPPVRSPTLSRAVSPITLWGRGQRYHLSFPQAFYLLFCCCDAHCDQSNLGSRGFTLAYRLPSIAEQSQGGKSSRDWSRNHEGHCSLAHFPAHARLASLYSLDLLPRNSAAHSGLASHINHQSRWSLTDLPPGQSDWCSSSTGSPGDSQLCQLNNKKKLASKTAKAQKLIPSLESHSTKKK